MHVWIVLLIQLLSPHSSYDVAPTTFYIFLFKSAVWKIPLHRNVSDCCADFQGFIILLVQVLDHFLRAYFFVTAFVVMHISGITSQEFLCYKGSLSFRNNNRNLESIITMEIIVVSKILMRKADAHN